MRMMRMPILRASRVFLVLLLLLVTGTIIQRTANAFSIIVHPIITKQQKYSPSANRHCHCHRSTVELSATTTQQEEVASPPPRDGGGPTRVVVIGGGWAGFSVADALICSSSNSCHITLLEASPRGPGGLAAGWKSPKIGKTVEAGIHGFWRNYDNTFEIIERVTGGQDAVLTDYMPSVLISDEGTVAVAPVLGPNKQNDVDDDDNGTWTTNNALLQPGAQILKVLQEAVNSSNRDENDSFQKRRLRSLSKLLPPPLDLALLSDFSNDILSVTDRVSALGLLSVWADFDPTEPQSWEKYDTKSAESVFRQAGVTNALYQNLVSPLLHVLPMCPGYDCSAAAALSCFHYYALQSPGAFDVKWCKGSITEKIFNPWVDYLVDRNVSIRGNATVTNIIKKKIATTTTTSGPITKQKPVVYSITINDNEVLECDAIVLAVGIRAAQRLAETCPVLENIPAAQLWKNLRGVTCICCRLFYDSDSTAFQTIRRSRVFRESPVLVCGPRLVLPELLEIGFCLYDLTRLQDEFKVTPDINSNTVAALEVDFFRADTFVNQTDEEIIHLTLKAISAAVLEQKPRDADGFAHQQARHLLDASVVRARQAVSHFAPGSASSCSKSVRLSKTNSNDRIYICGDWIERTKRHASWSTEKSVVTGRQAAQALLDDFEPSGRVKEKISIVPTVPDTPPLALLRKLISR